MLVTLVHGLRGSPPYRGGVVCGSSTPGRPPMPNRPKERDKLSLVPLPSRSEVELRVKPCYYINQRPCVPGDTKRMGEVNACTLHLYELVALQCQ